MMVVAVSAVTRPVSVVSPPDLVIASKVSKLTKRPPDQRLYKSSYQRIHQPKLDNMGLGW